MVLRTALLLLAISEAAAAQLVGVSLGKVWSTVDWQLPKPPASCDFCISDISPHDFRESFAPALMWQGAPERSVGFSTEARYTIKGYATTQPTLDVQYFEVPTLLRLGAISGRTFPVKPFLEVGPAFAIRAHCEVDVNGSADPCDRTTTLGQDWRVRAFDVSGILGAGLAIRSGQYVTLVGARYDYGFVNIGSTGHSVPTKNRSGIVYVGWLWQVRSSPR